jgi:hypothetical protein
MARRVKYYYDTEFHERGGASAIEAISIGIVAEDGRTYYAVYDDFDTRAVASNEWLMKNVMSTIDHDQFVVADFEGKPLVRDIYVTDKDSKPRTQIAAEIIAFVQGTEPEWWNWYGAYDHVVLCQTFGTMMDLPHGFPMFSCDLKQLHRDKGYPPMPRQPNGLHNALDDAKFNVVRYNYLKGL